MNYLKSIWWYGGMYNPEVWNKCGQTEERTSNLVENFALDIHHCCENKTFDYLLDYLDKIYGEGYHTIEGVLFPGTTHPKRDIDKRFDKKRQKMIYYFDLIRDVGVRGNVTKHTVRDMMIRMSKMTSRKTVFPLVLPLCSNISP